MLSPLNFLPLALAIGLFLLWPSGNPLQRDAWYRRYLEQLNRFRWLRRRTQWHLAIGLLPALALAWLVGVLPPVGELCVAALVLLYSFGRGALGAKVADYVRACEQGDYPSAAYSACQQGVPAQQEAGQWAQLHNQMLEAVAYQGLERFFAVVFWFVLLGPVGAFAYRLLQLYATVQPSPAWLRVSSLVDWLPARLLAASFAVTGNFVGSVNKLRAPELNREPRAGRLLAACALGALSLDDHLVQTCDASAREVEGVLALYRRTLWLWIGLISVGAILFW